MGCDKKMACAGCGFFWGLLMFVMIFLGEFLVPSMIAGAIDDLLPIKSQSNLDDMFKDGADIKTAPISITFFNLTNGYELMTVTPAPKPHFVPVVVDFEETETSFDWAGGYDSAKGSYKYSSYTRYRPLNPADMQLEIVNVNAFYLGAIYGLAPSERTVFGALAHTVLGTMKSALEGFAAMVVIPYASSNTAFYTQMITVNGVTSDLTSATGIATTAASIAAAQMATGGFSDALISAQMSAAITGTSVANIAPFTAAVPAVCAPIEVIRYLTDAATNPFTTISGIAQLLGGLGYTFSSFTMTGSQAAAFFNVLTSTNSPLQLSGLGAAWAAQMQAAGAAAAAGDAAAATTAQTTAAGIAANIYAAYGATFGTLMGTPLGGGTAVEVCGSTVTAACPVVALAYAYYLIDYLGGNIFTGCLVHGPSMNSDGTGSLNGALFTRRTVEEIMHGYSDPIMTAVPASALTPSQAADLSVFNGRFENYSRADTTLADVNWLINNGVENKTKEFMVEYNGGGSDVDDKDKWVVRYGYTSKAYGYNDTNGPDTDSLLADPPLSSQYTIAGRRSQNVQPNAGKAFGAFDMVMNDFEVSEMKAGSAITFFLSSARREVTIGCGAGGSTTGSCAWHDVKGIKTLKYAGSDSLLKMTVNGATSTTCGGTTSFKGGHFSAAPTGTPPSCDFIQRHDGVINLELDQKLPAGLSMAYLGKTSTAVRDAVSITAAVGDTTEIVFDESQHELALFFDPLTGMALKGYERLQINLYVDKTFLDSARYANLFSATTDNGDTFVWPWMYISRIPQIKDKDAKDYKDAIYGMYYIGMWLAIVGIVLCPTFCICGVCMLRMKSSAAVAADEKKVSA